MRNRDVCDRLIITGVQQLQSTIHCAFSEGCISVQLQVYTHLSVDHMWKGKRLNDFLLSIFGALLKSAILLPSDTTF